MVKVGWNAELAAEIQLEKSALGRCLQSGFDQSGLKNRSGKLRAALANTKRMSVTPFRRSVRVTISIPLPYAAIQDAGGTSPAVEGKRMCMPWGWRTRRKASKINPSGYIELGFQEFCDKHAINGGIRVRWK